jgi:AraC-like DNA-binding protein
MHTQILEITQCFNDTVMFFDFKECTMVMLNAETKEEINTMGIAITQKIHTHYSQESCALIQCYAGIYVDCIVDIPNSFREANRLNIHGVLDNGTGYYDANEILTKRELKTYDYVEDITTWKESVIFGKNTATETLKSMIAQMKTAGYLLVDYRLIASSMLDILNKDLKLAGMNTVGLPFNFETCSEDTLTNFLFDLTEKSKEFVQIENMDKESYIAQKALEYVDNNYYDSNLDLPSICNYLNISISYFSTVFKRYNNMTFIKYLNGYRVEKAKYYLKHSQKNISEISEMVGYIEPHYFGIVFKRYVGITPKKYRKTHE